MTDLSKQNKKTSFHILRISISLLIIFSWLFILINPLDLVLYPYERVVGPFTFLGPSIAAVVLMGSWPFRHPKEPTEAKRGFRLGVFVTTMVALPLAVIILLMNMSPLFS